MANLFADLLPAQQPKEEKKATATRAANSNLFADLVSGPSIDSISTPPPLGDPQGAVATPALQQTPDVILPYAGDEPRYGPTLLYDDTDLGQYNLVDDEVARVTSDFLGPMLGSSWTPGPLGNGGIVPEGIYNATANPSLMTHDGLPSRKNPDGSQSTEVSITVTDPRINNGLPTNIPSLWGGIERDQETSILKALESGNQYPAFNTIPEAVTAARVRSSMGGASQSPLIGQGVSAEQGTANQDFGLVSKESLEQKEQLTRGREMKPAPEPGLWDQFLDLIPGNKDQAYVEWQLRRMTQEENARRAQQGLPPITIEDMYGRVGGSRDMLNPEGRPPIRSFFEGAEIVAKQAPHLHKDFANTFLRVIRGRDIDSARANSWLDEAIEYTDREYGDLDPNYQSFNTVGESLAYSLTTLVSAAIASATVTAATKNPVAGVTAGVTASGTVAYRGSSDKFLDDIRKELNDRSLQLGLGPLSDEAWEQARKDFDAAAAEYGAWEAIPEALGNAIFLRAFAKPLMGSGREKALDVAKKAAITQSSEQITETITALGQNRVEVEAGLTGSEMTIGDAFRSQAIQTLVTTAGMGGGTIAVQKGNEFIEKKRDEADPQRVIGREMQSQVDSMVPNPEATQQIINEQLRPPVLPGQVRPEQTARQPGDVGPSAPPNLFSDLVPGVQVPAPTQDDQGPAPQTVPQSQNLAPPEQPTPFQPQGSASVGSGSVQGNSQVATVTGQKVDVAYEIVEGKNLRQASEDLQPRDRSRQSSDDQIRQIAQNLDPQRLGYSAEADRGAPIIGPDNIIESGNGRVRAINMAYDTNPQAAELYRQFLIQQGYADAANFERPILVRRRTTQMTDQERRQFVIEANQSATMAMSSTEQSRSDTVKLTPAVMAAWRGGEVTSAANRDFVRQFIQSVVPQSEQNQMMGQDGQLSIDGKRRIENAMLGKAYENPEILAQMTESTDNNIRSISGSLLDTAGRWAQMREEIAAGRIPAEYDLTPQLTEAARVVSQLRAQGMTAADWVAQEDMLNPRDPATTAFVKSFYNAALTRAAGRENINAVLNGYVDAVMAQSTQSMFGDTVQPQEIIEQQTRIRNEGNQGGEQAGLFDVVGQGAENPGRRDTQRGRGQGPAALQGDRERATGQGQQPVRDQDTGNAERETVQAQNQRAETEDGAVNDGPQTDTAEGRADRTEDQAGAQLDTAGQGNAGQVPRPIRYQTPQGNSRGTRVGQFVEVVSFTNRQSFYRIAFRDAGYDPAEAVNFPIQRQFDIVASLIQEKFGVRFVDKAPRASSRKSVDELLDLYRNMQFMMAALELPMNTIGLEGSLGILALGKKPYFGVYYPQGGALIEMGTKYKGSQMFEGAFIGMPGRSNSFGHEWGHALDFFLQDKFGRRGFGSGGLSGFIREEGIAEGPMNSEQAFKNLIMTLFYDKAEVAAEIMELEKKIATTKSDKVRTEAEDKLKRLREGNTRMRKGRSEYAQGVKGLQNDSYYLKPTEMIARSFETYLSGKIEAIGGDTEAIVKGIANYSNESVAYMQMAYPQISERAKINQAWEDLFDALRAEEILHRDGDKLSPIPGNLDILDPDVALEHTEKKLPILRREIEALKQQRAEHKRNEENPKNPKGPVKRFEDIMSSTLYSDRGVLLTMQARYPNSGTLRSVVARLTTDPGNPEANNSIAFSDDVKINLRRYAKRFEDIRKKYDLDKLDVAEMELLRMIMTGAPAANRSKYIASLEKEGYEVKELEPRLVEAADQIRSRIYNPLWYYANNNNVQVGYAQNAYLPRVINHAKFITKPQGFVNAASEVYNLMFDSDFSNFEDSEKALVGLLKRGAELAKYKKAPRVAKSDLSPGFETSLFDEEGIEQLQAAISAYNDYAKAARALSEYQQQVENDPDKLDQEKMDKLERAAEGAKDKAIDFAGNAYDTIKDVDGYIRAGEWAMNIWADDTGPDHHVPDSDFTKQRTLPPEADWIMRDFMESDVINLTFSYIPKLIRNVEYERRFSGDFEWSKVVKRLTEDGVLDSDISQITQSMQAITSRARDTSMSGADRFVTNVNNIGITAMLGRALLSALAEPMGAAVQSRSFIEGFRAMGDTLRAFVKTANQRELMELAEYIGLITDPHMDSMAASREGGEFSDDPKMNRMMARYFIYTLQSGWLNRTRVGTIRVGQRFILNRLRVAMTDKDKTTRDRAVRDLQDFGLRLGDLQQLYDWLTVEEEGQPSFMDGRKITPDDLKSDMGKVYSRLLFQFGERVILDPKPEDKSRLSKTTFGRVVQAIQSWAYAFQRQYLIASAKRIQKEYKLGGKASAARVAGGVAAGFGALYMGQLAFTIARELIFNPDQWDKRKRDGTLDAYLLQLAFSRMGAYGAFDPLVQMINGLRYQRSILTVTAGAVPSYFAQGIERILKGFVNNSENTNTGERNLARGLYEVGFIPFLAYQLSARAPLGPISTPAVAAFYGWMSSPGMKNDVSTFFAGPSEHQKKMERDARSRGEVRRDELRAKREKRREKAAERRDRER